MKPREELVKKKYNDQKNEQERILRPLARVQWPQKPQPQTERESARKKSLRLEPRLFRRFRHVHEAV